MLFLCLVFFKSRPEVVVPDDFLGDLGCFPFLDQVFDIILGHVAAEASPWIVVQFEQRPDRGMESIPNLRENHQERLQIGRAHV